MSNLPEWPGADTVYKRLEEINNKLSKAAYEARTKKILRNGGKWTAFVVPEEVEENIAAMNRGDEEACKAGVARNLHLCNEEHL